MFPILISGASQFNLSLTHNQLTAFERYLQELIAWNEQVNLTSITEPAEIITKHFLDSLSVYLVLQDLPPTVSLIDVGSGAGFPGIPLKIALPQLRLTLLEATGKKTAFLQHLLPSLNLNKVAVITARAEEAGQHPKHREHYEVAVARAVAGLPVLAEYTLPLVKVGGRVIVQKGQDPTAEVQQAAQALRILGGKVQQVMPVTVPGLAAQRHLIVIQKIKATPRQYPRRPGLPAKTPL